MVLIPKAMVELMSEGDPSVLMIPPEDREEKDHGNKAGDDSSRKESATISGTRQP
jgi:hypothetical protein